MTPRTIRGVVPAATQHFGPGLTTWDVPAERLGDDMDPFIVVSMYEMTGPTFPPHPHAGFAVATYMLPESPVGFVNQDTLGHRNPIPPGALHVTVAARGVQHEEQPATAGPKARGFQIWIDLPNALRRMDPHALTLAAHDVPVWRDAGATVRVVLGTAMGLASPLDLPLPLRLLDVALRPGARVVQPLDRAENAFVFMVEGTVTVNGHAAGAGEIVHTAPDGEALAFEAGAAGARFTLFAGVPLRQPRVQQGPFVAGDAAELRHFMREFAAGRFGRLIPFAQQPFQP